MTYMISRTYKDLLRLSMTCIKLPEASNNACAKVCGLPYRNGKPCDSCEAVKRHICIIMALYALIIDNTQVPLWRPVDHIYLDAS